MKASGRRTSLTSGHANLKEKLSTCTLVEESSHVKLGAKISTATLVNEDDLDHRPRNAAGETIVPLIVHVVNCILVEAMLQFFKMMRTSSFCEKWSIRCFYDFAITCVFTATCKPSCETDIQLPQERRECESGADLNNNTASKWISQQISPYSSMFSSHENKVIYVTN